MRDIREEGRLLLPTRSKEKSRPNNIKSISTYLSFVERTLESTGVLHGIPSILTPLRLQPIKRFEQRTPSSRILHQTSGDPKGL